MRGSAVEVVRRDVFSARRHGKEGINMATEMKSFTTGGNTKSPERSSAASLGTRAKAGRPYLYVVGGNGTAIIDPSNWQVVFVAPRAPPKNGRACFRQSLS
jgi:hypothetical protein